MTLPKTTLVVLLTTLCLAQTARADSASATPDPWFGRDKVLHFAGSALLAAGGYGMAADVFPDEAPRLILGGGLSLLVGAGKELIDSATSGHPSWKDFAWDVVGAAAGLFVAWAVHQLLAEP